MSDFPIKGLLVAFAAEFSIQQLLEIADPIVSMVLKIEVLKKSLLRLVSLVLGGVIASVGQIHIFNVLVGHRSHLGVQLHFEVRELQEGSGQGLGGQPEIKAFTSGTIVREFPGRNSCFRVKARERFTILGGAS